MFGPVLVVCVGNICRSPLGERALKSHLPDLEVSSAGLAALVGHAADETAASVAAESGLSLEGHAARQMTAELGAKHQLILVMEPGHRSEIMRRFPQLSGRTMLFDQWTRARGISDPYRKPIEFHREVRDQILKAAAAWATRLQPRS